MMRVTISLCVLNAIRSRVKGKDMFEVGDNVKYFYESHDKTQSIMIDDMVILDKSHYDVTDENGRHEGYIYKVASSNNKFDGQWVQGWLLTKREMTTPLASNL